MITTIMPRTGVTLTEVIVAISPNYRSAIPFSPSPQKIKTKGWKVEVRNQTSNLKSASLTSHTGLTLETDFDILLGKSESPTAQREVLLMLCFKRICMSFRSGVQN